MNLNTIFKKIYELKINDIFVEAGGIFFTNLINNKLVNELHLFKSKKNIGKRGKPVLVGKSISDLDTKKILSTKFENDIYTHFKIF